MHKWYSEPGDFRILVQMQQNILSKYQSERNNYRRRSAENKPIKKIVRDQLLVMPAMRHRYHLRNGNGHTYTNHKRDIQGINNKSSGSKLLVADSAHHGGINNVQGHLCQFTNDDWQCQFYRA